MVINVGLIGAGNSAKNISTSLLTMTETAILVALSDTQMDEVNKIHEAHGVPDEMVFADYHDLLNLPEVEVVIVSVPHNLHYAITLDALNAGKHVLCEKPLAMNMEQGQEMIALAQEKGLILGTFFQNRFFDASQKAKEIIQNGEIGQILHAQCNVLWYRDQEYYDTSPWRGKWTSEGGGSLINQASHSIDLMIWLLGQPKKVFGVFGAKTHQIEVDDNAAAVVEFENGVFATIQTSTSLQPGYPAKVNIFGTEGSISIDGNALKIVDKDKNETNYDYESEVGSSNDPKKFSLQAQQRLLADYFDALANNRSPLVDGAEGLRAIQVITAIYESNGEKVVYLH